MIPKIIHYCWFGGKEKPEIVHKCIASWKKFCPDYEIKEWNTENFDVNSCDFSKEAFEAKKWAFVADYARLCVLEEYGGFYFDTDMELFESLDIFQNDTGVLGFEAKDFVACGIIGVEKGNKMITQLKEDYENTHFLLEDGSLDMVSNVRRMKKYLMEKGMKENGKLQKAGEFTLYPQYWFYPNTLGMLMGKTPKKSVTVHHAMGSWRDNNGSGGVKKATRGYLVNKARNIVGTDFLENLKK